MIINKKSREKRNAFKGGIAVLAGYVGAFSRNQAGAIALIFALAIPVLFAAVGMSVDLAQAQLVRTRLANALDKAALAVANSSGDQDELEVVMNDFFLANYPEEVIGSPYDLLLVIDDEANTVTISAKADVDARFVRIFGKDNITVEAETEVTRELSGLEVVLVLDVTGSMAGTNIAALRTAAENFIDIMFEEVSDPEFLKIGIVPYSTSVNVGPYGLGQNPDGTYYDVAFVNNPDGKVWDMDDDQEWKGCVLARDEPDDATDAHPDDWDMYEHYRTTWQCVSYTWWWCSEYEYTPDPNYNCTEEYVMPLNNDQASLVAKVQGLDAEGFTLTNIGLVWGWRVLSPGFPFTEAEEYDNSRWRKAIVLMTDGDNVMASDYSAYGRTSDHSISSNDLDDKMADVCENIKDEDITMYTVTFESGVGADTRQYFEDCASDPTKYTHAPSQQELIDTFEDIAEQLSKLHISR